MSKGISTVYNDTSLFEMIILEIPMHTESPSIYFLILLETGILQIMHSLIFEVKLKYDSMLIILISKKPKRHFHDCNRFWLCKL